MPKTKDPVEALDRALTAKDDNLVSIDPELAEIFKSSYQLTEQFVNEVVQLPVLKLVYQKQGEDPIMADGKACRDIQGQNVPLYTYYHSQTNKWYEEPEVVIMAVKRAKLATYIDPDKLQYNELMGGFLLEDRQPFVMFFKSLALSPWWATHKQIADKARQMGVPAFALVCKLTVGKRDSLDGKFKNIRIPQVEMTEKLLTDKDLVKYLADNVETVTTGLKSFIEMKNTNQVVEENINEDDIPA